MYDLDLIEDGLKGNQIFSPNPLDNKLSTRKSANSLTIFCCSPLFTNSLPLSLPTRPLSPYNNSVSYL